MEKEPKEFINQKRLIFLSFPLNFNHLLIQFNFIDGHFQNKTDSLDNKVSKKSSWRRKSRFNELFRVIKTS